MKTLAGLALLGALESCAAPRASQAPQAPEQNQRFPVLLRSNESLICRNAWRHEDESLDGSECRIEPNAIAQPPQPAAEPPRESERIKPLAAQVPLSLSEQFRSGVISILTIETPNESLVACAQAITRQLHRLLAEAGCQIGESRNLTEMKVIFCEGIEGPDCLARVGQALGANKVIYGHLRLDAIPASKKLDLTLLDAGGRELSRLDGSPIDCSGPAEKFQRDIYVAVRILLEDFLLR